MIRYDVSTLPSLLALTLIALAVGDARSAVATFDGFAEGPIASPFVDGGITFSMPKTSSGGGNVFTVERADATLSGPFFSVDNALAMGGFAPGPGSGFPAIGSFRMTPAAVANAISVEMFYLDNPNAGGNVAELNLLLGGAVVASDSLVLPGAGGGAVQHHTLSVNGVLFDEAEINSSGAFQSGAYFALFDNVRINVIPEPSAFATAAACGGVALPLRRRRHQAEGRP